MQSWAWVIQPLPTPATFPVAFAWGAAGLHSLAWLGGFLPEGRWACRLALPVAALQAFWLLPFTANHTVLALAVLALFAALDPRDEQEGALLLQTLRWMAVLIFFWAGLQKALHGCYFRGEFLAWMIGQGVELWSQTFAWFVPADEIARLRSLDRFRPGAGPFRAQAPLLWGLSNGVWVGEIGLAFGLLWRRTRTWAALGAIGLVVTIQLAPREWMFALLYAQLLLLFVPGAWNRRLLPLFLLTFAALLVALLGGPGRELLLKAGGGL